MSQTVYCWKYLPQVRNTVRFTNNNAAFNVPFFLVPSPVDSLSVNFVSETMIVVKWISSNNKNDDIKHYTLNYQPLSCPLSSVTSINIPSIISTHTLTGLYNGMNYTISIITVNTLGQSLPVTITQQTLPTGIEYYYY